MQDAERYRSCVSPQSADDFRSRSCGAAALSELRGVRQTTGCDIVAVGMESETKYLVLMKAGIGGWGQRGVNWTKIDEQTLLAMVQSGKSWSVIGVRLKRTSVSVRQRYNKLIAPARQAVKKQQG